jgi:hypothetical protein
MQRFWAFIVFCTLSAEFDGFYGNHWSTFERYLGDILFNPVPGIRVPWYDIIVLFLLFAGGKPNRARPKPIVTALSTTLLGIFLWALLGASRNGSVLDMRLQLHTIVMVMLTALMQIRLLRTREHYVMLGKAVVYAAVLRSLLITYFYFAIWRNLTVELQTATEHGDSILFVTCIVVVIAHALHHPAKKTIWRAVLIVFAMLWAIQLNNRRLAYVSLVGSLVIIVALIWTGELRKKLQRPALYAALVLAVYAAAGWSHPTGIFKPLSSLQSVSDVNNPSTQSRILEDIGLIVTLQQGPLLGTGFGQKYIEISTTFSVQGFFPQYRYVPHNSVLGLIAFTGAAGFSLIWMIFPVTAYFAARSYHFAKQPMDKTIAMAAICQVIVHTAQMWGDIGITAIPGLVCMSGAIAASAHVAVFSGAWPGPVKPAGLPESRSAPPGRGPT